MTTVVHVKKDTYDVFIGRPSKWGNPHNITEVTNRPKSISNYRSHILASPFLLASLHEVRDKVLGCFCDPLPCHGHVIADLADNYIFFNSYSLTPYHKLSNFFDKRLEIGSGEFRSVEHYYQYCKAKRSEDKDKIIKLHSPEDVKKFSKTIQCIDNWDDARVKVMIDALIVKFNDSECVDVLKNTGNKTLVHLSPWDSFWGSGQDGGGNNTLGVILMALRDQLQSIS